LPLGKSRLARPRYLLRFSGKWYYEEKRKIGASLVRYTKRGNDIKIEMSSLDFWIFETSCLPFQLFLSKNFLKIIINISHLSFYFFCMFNIMSYQITHTHTRVYIYIYMLHFIYYYYMKLLLISWCTWLFICHAFLYLLKYFKI